MSAILESLRKRQTTLDTLRRHGQWDSPALRNVGNLARLAGGKLLLSKADALDSVDESRMAVTFVISTLGQDRHGDVVIPKGCVNDLPSYEKNPVVLLNHNSWGKPVGVSRTPEGKLAIQVMEDRILGTCFFHGVTQEAVETYELCRLKIYQGASIGFIPKRAERVKPIEDENLPKNEIDFTTFYCSFIFKLWELVEWSVVTIPANRDAVSMVLGKGMLAGKRITETTRRQLEPYKLPRRCWDTGCA